mmetsp:Transcript_35856/g.57827  ORF Transcript_35856/g.57827 Transcript_35856/m.57827 type:complete len:120 (-) Transcript_35856:15-374(-)
MPQLVMPRRTLVPKVGKPRLARAGAAMAVARPRERCMREIRKFRTLDNGKSIEVGSVVDGVPFTTWAWRVAANAAAGHAKANSGSKGGKAKAGKGRGGDGGGKAKGEVHAGDPKVPDSR